MFLKTALEIDYEGEKAKIESELESITQEKMFISTESEALDKLLEDLYCYIHLSTDEEGVFNQSQSMM